MTIAGALLSGLFGFILYRKKTVREYRKQMFDAINGDLNRLLQTDDDCMHFLNDMKLRKHEAAVNNLMAHVGFVERYRLKRKWYALAMVKIDNDHHIPDYSQYADFGSIDKRRRIRPVIIKRLGDLMTFCK